MKKFLGSLFCLCLMLCLLAITANAEGVQVALPTNGNKFVYANGNAIVIEQDGVYWDKNSNGVKDDGDEYLCVADRNTSVYGGTLESDITANPMITMNGGTVDRIVGGNRKNSKLTGNVVINIKGGSVKYRVMGVGENASVDGNTAINIQNGDIASVVATGDSSSVNLTGNCTINISGGDIGTLFATRFASIDGDSTVNVTGGSIDRLYAVFMGTIRGTATVNATGGSIRDLYYSDDNNGSCGAISIFTDSNVEVGSLRAADESFTIPDEFSVTILDANGCKFYNEPDNFAANFLARQSNGNWVVKGNVTLASGNTLTVSEDATLIIPEGATLTNNGTIIMNGKYENNGGTLNGSGTKTCNSHTFDTLYVCTFCGYVCTHAEYKDATCTVPKTCKVCPKTQGEALGHHWNYTLSGEKITVTCDRACGLAASDLAMNIQGGYYKGGVYWFENEKTATVYAPDGFTLSNGNSTYGVSYEFSQNEQPQISLKNQTDGSEGNLLDLSNLIKWDTTAPGGTIRIGDICSSDEPVEPVYCAFVKSEQSVEITAEDMESGVKEIAYCVASQKESDPASLSYSAYTGDNGITLSFGKHIVYVRITDNAGNVTYINSNGIVIYQDAVLEQAEGLSFYQSGEDFEVNIQLKGNAVKEVKCGNEALESGTDYTDTADGIILDSQWLDTLAVGEYVLTISINPLGETYMEAPSNASPAECSFVLRVEKAMLTPVITGRVTKTYDGTNAVPENGFSISFAGVLGGDLVASTADFAFDGVNAGTSLVHATNIQIINEFRDKYLLSADHVSADVGQITKAPLIVTAKEQTVSYAEAIDTSAYTLVGLVNGQTASVTLTPSTEVITQSGTITPAVTVTAGNTDVTENYDITAVPGKLIITLDTSLVDDTEVKDVQFDSKEEIEQILGTVEELLESGELTDAQKAELTETKEKAEKLLDRIEKAMAAVGTEEIGDTLDTTADNVKPQDKDSIQQAVEDLQNAIDNYSGNYTQQDLEDLQEQIDVLKDALKALEKADAVTTAIGALPETVDPDDEETAVDILAAKVAYDALSDHEKSLVDADKLDALLKALVDYKITKGNGAQWEKGKLKFTANGPFRKFVAVFVDGKEVDSAKYLAVPGSTIITFKEGFLEELDTGEHTITVTFTDGAASGKFTILKDTATEEETEPTTKPTEPEKEEPTKPTEPEKEEPTKPTEPEKEEPTKPTEPEKEEPTKPTEPEKEEPTKPTEPGKDETTKPTEPPAKPVNPNIPDTGDNANPMLWVALMAAAVYVLWLGFKKRIHA